MICSWSVTILVQPLQKVGVDYLGSLFSRDFIPGHLCKTLRQGSGLHLEETLSAIRDFIPGYQSKTLRQDSGLHLEETLFLLAGKNPV